MAKDLSRQVTIYVNGKEINNTIASIRAEMKKLEREQKHLVIGSDEYLKKAEDYRYLSGLLKEQKVHVEKMGQSWKSACEHVANMSNILMGVQTAFQMIDQSIGTLKDLAADYAEMDDVYADVMKTTGLAKDEVLKLNESFKRMDTRTSREQLNQLAYEAGKLGLSSQEAVEQFVSASDKINIALGDVLGDGAMVTIGKLAEVYSKSTKQLSADGKTLEDQMLAIGSAVNQLGQESTANEGYLVEFLSRMGGIATQANLSADAILGFASALDQDMMKQEMSATAFQKFIMQMIKKPSEFAKAAGMEVSKFADLMQKDMNEALLSVLKGFQGQGGLIALQPIFEDLGLDAARAASVISSMANSIDEIRAAQESANEQLATGNSIMNEFNTKNNTAQAEAEKAKKRFQDVRIELGEKLYPVLVHLQKTGTVMLKGAASMTDVLKAYPALIVPIVSMIVAWNRAAIVQYLQSGKLTNLLSRLNPLTKAGAVATQFKTAATLKNVEAEEEARLAYFRSRLEEEKKILADRTYMYTEEGLTRQARAKAEAERWSAMATSQAVVVEEAHTKALHAKRAAWLGVPWGMIIAGLTAIVALAVKLRNANSDVKLAKSMREAGKAAGEAEGHIDVLRMRLEKAAEGSDEYRKALEELKSLYPEIIALHTDEEGKLKDLDKMYKELGKAARQSAYDRMYAEKVSETQGVIGDELEKAMQKSAKYIDKVLKNLSDKDRAYYKQSANDILVEITNGTKTSVTALAEFDRLMKAATGQPKFNTGYLSWFGDLYNKVTKCNQGLDDLKTELNARVTDPDPFGIAKMSLKEMNKELATSQKLVGSYLKQAELGREGFGQKYDNEMKKIEALKAAIEKKKSGQQNTAGGGASLFQTEVDSEVKKWEQVKDAAQGLIARFEVKSQEGLSQSFADIDRQAEDMIEKVKTAAKAAGVSSKETVDGIKKAAEAYRAAKLEEYVKKYSEGLEKVADQSSGNPMLDKVNQVAASMKPYDDKIRKLTEDQAALSEKDAEAAKQIGVLIERYKALREQLAQSAYSVIDTSVDTSGFALSGNAAEDWKKYDELTTKINNAKAAATALLEKTTDPVQREVLEAELEDLDQQRDTLDGIIAGADELEKKVQKSKAMDKLIEQIEYFGNQAMKIFSSVNDILSNMGKRELKEAEKLKEANTKNLDDQLEQQLISQEEYDKRKAAIEEEYDAKQKEIERKQWQREKWLNASEAAMAAALAIMRVWSDAGNGTTAMRAAQTAVVGAATAAQLGAILSEPEPYAKGGYVKDKKIMVGEAGSEWIASHRLLTDPATAPLISALDSYQRNPMMAQVNMPAVRSAEQYRVENQGLTAAMLTELRTLSAYLKDPENRRAVISRRTQEDFERNENFLRSQAKF